jgi:DNA-directed RNA polymerase subunit RPC12/RpoP
MEEIDHQGTDEVICPHCGASQGDDIHYWQLQDMGTCDECGRSFSVSVEYEYSYYTEKEEEKGNG